MTATIAPVEFAEDPIASHSAQFPLARSFSQPSVDGVPSSAELRPWNLRAMQVPRAAVHPLPEYRYDHEQQAAVTPDGHTLIDIVDATANSVTDNDGDEGRSEDWTYDFAPDQPFPAR
ncbi:putative ATP-grasp-modified RiPP [Actinoalloteichus hymeniacidonis]|uniref:ATP-grasp target RiPP n=1 Tax=Actinoalloteichus hymeniacidonis TaxID=340345 RepID=A0AAC9MZM4_9PSEU|nr:putative ATP-grasp-modified RiPP [Actinoalloteichus hymeniacidonis]AOS65563.1 putative ATP-grasp target RiPP [Actinoalloteichus hymeniacidonis]MBB5906347.1 putative ATP-grasp target RiPP [Actinoalloteichus hymeniacidonis]